MEDDTIDRKFNTETSPYPPQISQVLNLVRELDLLETQNNPVPLTLKLEAIL
jgi:hypothetical protein